MKIGANYIGKEGCEFVVWAPFLKKVELKIIPPVGVMGFAEMPPHIMEKGNNGYWKKVIEGIPPGALYFYRLEEEKERP
ncbi:MAG: malto-oligosyltrehalose trehalohydrolase, partial [Ignavibacteriales bacterium]